MPQMSPLMWFNLFTLFSLIFLFFMVKIYFLSNKNIFSETNSLNPTFKNSLSWVW